MNTFDPYLNWLGIPAHEQPPNFYRLLGIVLFESNPVVIEQAADRQSLTVGAYQAGPYADLCQRLLGEIAMARFNLLDPQQKAGYDAYLQSTLAHRGERMVAAPPPPGYPAGYAPQAMPPQPAYSPQPLQQPLPRPLPTAPQGYRTASPVTAPVAVPFPIARAASNGSAPAAPPAIPPAAPQRPMDELENLTAQSTTRRRVGNKKRQADYSKEIMFGGIAAAAAVVLVIIYIAAQESTTPGLGGVGGSDKNNMSNPVAPKAVGDKPKAGKEKNDAAVAATRTKNAGQRTSAASQPLPPRKAPAASDDNDIQIKVPAATPTPQQPNRNDIDTPQQLGGPDDPVMGKPDE
jgi:hypothetical protein